MRNNALRHAGTCWGVSDLTSHAVEASKDAVFRDARVQVDQRINADAVMRFHTEEVNEVWQTYK